MTSLIVPDLDDTTRQKLEAIAIRHGRTVEEEAREILRGAVRDAVTPGPSDLGSRIAARFATIGIEERICELRGHDVSAPTFE